LSEVLKILVLALEILNEESSALGLEINWFKTNIQTSCDMKPSTIFVPNVPNNQVDVMESFVYL